MMSDPTLFSKGNIVFDDPKEFDDPQVFDGLKVISNESMVLNDPKEFDDPQLFDDPKEISFGIMDFDKGSLRVRKVQFFFNIV